MGKLYYQAAARLGQQHCDQIRSSGDRESGTETAWQLRCLQEQPRTSAFTLSPPPPEPVKTWLLSTWNAADSSSEECPPNHGTHSATCQL